MMEHLPRFRRRSKHPVPTSDGKSTAPTTGERDVPVPATLVRDQAQKPAKKPALRGFHLRGATKRARSPPVATLQSSQHTAVVMHDVGIGPAALTEATMKRQESTISQSPHEKPMMPAFLKYSGQELEQKFQDLTWNERHRIAFGRGNQEMAKSPPRFQLFEVQRVGMDRYTNIKPWTHTRVKLKVPADQLDYVNASSIALESPSDPSLPPLRYIAMQGPTEQSIEYVWRMVAEQLTTPVVIVQLTDMFEQGSQKCYPYFPHGEVRESWRLNENDAWGDKWTAVLRFEEMQVLADGAIEVRKMALRVQEEDEERVVWHMLYKRWPDFGVPAMEDLDSFFLLMKRSQEYSAQGNPRIIHCSAGVGRTGTFMAIEHLNRELEAGHFQDCGEEGESIDPIFQTVDLLREQRRSMVQAESQYFFIYQVLRKLWQRKHGVEEGEGMGDEPAPKRLEVADPFLD